MFTREGAVRFVLRWISLVPLFYFARLAMLCAATAVGRITLDPGPALMFAALALACTLGYPAMVEVERRLIARNPALKPLPIGAYDVIFLAGGALEAWQLGAHGLQAIPLIVALIGLWIIGGAVARQRIIALQTGATREPSKEKPDGTARPDRPRNKRSRNRGGNR